MRLLNPRNERAFTVLELMVVVFVLALLVLLLLPALARPRRGMRINCVNNLKQVGLSFRMWAGDNGDVYPMRYTNDFNGPTLANTKQMFIYFQVMSNELNTPKILVCPEDKRRVYATNFIADFNSSKVSYFAGLDADETKPEMLLAGDWNLTNGIALVNGVMTVTTNALPGWKKAVHQTSGIVALADGSVVKWTSADLKRFLRASTVATNRLVLPEGSK